MYYFGVRYYAAWLGRWTSSDPGGFVDGVNLYQYARGNPVRLVDERGFKAVEPENIEGGANKMNTKTEDGIEQINYRISYDSNNNPVITIVVTGKVIDYTDTDNASRLAERINDIDDSFWIGEEGSFSNWLLASEVNVSGLNFQDENGNIVEFDRAQVNFEFNFEAVDGMSEVSDDDHLILITNFTDNRVIYKGKGGLNGATNRIGGKVAWVDENVFYGPYDYFISYGEMVTAHEIIAHMMGLAHSNDSNGNVTKKNGVHSYSDKVTRQEARQVLDNLVNKNGKTINSGTNYSFTYGDHVKMPNVEYRGGGTTSVQGLGVDTGVVYRKEKQKQKG